MPISLRPPVAAAPTAPPFTPPAPWLHCAGGSILLLAGGVAAASVLVWHFANPDQIAFDDRLVIPAALAAAATAGLGVFGLTAPRRSSPAQDAATEAAAEAIREQLRRGRAVSWAGTVFLLPRGVQAHGTVYPWGQIEAARPDRRGRELLLFIRGESDPIAAVPMAAANFAAGRLVLREFIAPTNAGSSSTSTLEREPPRAAA